MAIIEVNNITKEFKLGQIKSLKHSVLNAFNHLRGREVEKPKQFKALKDISFNVEQGEVLGIIGQNGAGKSTLLKMLARISTPTRGEVKVHGAVAPLIEVGAGLIGDLTGRENIFLNGSILGLSRAEIKRKFDEIVAFAELEEFIDTPIKRYSSGMAVRLGFAIASSVDADILIVDEVLAVGDLAFQRKCFDRMEDMIKRQRKTVLLVSHNIRQVERICGRVLLLGNGKVVKDGLPRDVCNQFYEMNNDKILSYARSQTMPGRNGVISTGELHVEDCRLYIYGNNEPTDQISVHDSVVVAVAFRANVDLKQVDIGVGFHTTDFVYVATANSATLEMQRDFKEGRHTVECRFLDVPLMPGVYGVRIGFNDRNSRQMWYAENYRTFKVTAPKINVARASTMSLVDLHVNWSFTEEAEGADAVA